MSKEDKRKTIMVNEAEFTEFDSRRKALKMNSSELLNVLLNQEVERTTTLRIDNSVGFDTIAKELSKR